MQIIIFSSPSRETMLNALKNELKGFDIFVIDNPETFGKQNFWKRWEEARVYCLNSKHNEYLILPDDVNDLDLKEIKAIFKQKGESLFTCNVTNDGRKSCWGGAYFDCGGLSNRKTLSKLKVEQPTKEFFKNHISSGVGYQLTMQLRKIGAELMTPKTSLCNHGDHDSVMHYAERKRTPLIAKRRIKIVVGMATFKGREKFLKKTIESLRFQVDEINIYNNEMNPDLTDNGKFYFLQNYKEPVIYLSCDDDIIYPPTYAQDMVKSIQECKSIVTHHGRKLQRQGVSYYHGHTAYRCTGLVNKRRIIDVAGTGVTGFNTAYFNPVHIYKSKDLKMSDLVFSLEAKKQKKTITLITHKAGYIIAQPVPRDQTIYGNHKNNDSRQSILADEIQSLSSSMPNLKPR